MKSIFTTALCLVLSVCASATNYYFSATYGDDSRSAAQAANPATPWKSLTKLNAVFATLKPGDSLLLKRGDVFYGHITISRSGTASAPIVIGAYGTGNKPLISGFAPVTNWKSLGKGVYESVTAASSLSGVSIVTLNGKHKAKGRYPNSDAADGGYLTFEDFSSNTDIIDKELNSNINWTGAELVVRTRQFVVDRRKITAHSGNKITFNSNLTYVPAPEFGYFIQNDVRTLDQIGEWSYNDVTRKLSFFFGTQSPANSQVLVSTVSALVHNNNRDYITYTDLALTGGNDYGFDIRSSDHITIKNTDITYCGRDAIYGISDKYMQVLNNSISDCYNTAVNLRSACNYSLVKGNTVHNIALLPGMLLSGNNEGIGIRENGRANIIESNYVENSGYIGIRFGGEHSIVRNNIVKNFNLVKDDGGGIYTADTEGNTDVGQKVIGNIVMNGIGAHHGTPKSSAKSTSGIYLDDWSGNIEVTGNTVFDCNKAGIYLHNTKGIKVRNNTLYNNGTQIVIVHDKAANNPLRNITVRNNVMVSQKASQGVLYVGTVLNDFPLIGTFDSNYYCRPIDDGYVIKTTYLDATKTQVEQMLDLRGWQAIHKQDAHSKASPAKLMPYRITGLKGSNLFTNSSFDANIKGLTAYSTASAYTKNWVSNGADGGAFQGTITSKEVGAFVTSVPVGAVQAGKKYVVRFMAKSTKDTLMNLMLRTSGAPYTVLSNDGKKNTFTVSRTEKQYEVVFEPRFSSSNAVVIWETFGSAGFSIWYDKIVIQEANIQVTNPADSIELIYNDQPMVKSFALSDKHICAMGKQHQGSVTLSPFSSVVLIKRPELTKDTLPKKDTVVVKDSIPVKDSVVVKDTIPVKDTVVVIDTLPPAKDSIISTDTIVNRDSIINRDTVIVGGPVVRDSVIATPPVVRLNTLPTIKITSPVQLALVAYPSAVRLTATAKDEDGAIRKVEFYANGKLIRTEKVNPYDWKWPDATVGTYTLIAKAYDDSGAVAVSAPVSFTVIKKNIAPKVVITSPVKLTEFVNPSSVRLTATATDADGKIKRVEFYANGVLVRTEKVNPYDWNWTGAVKGSYILVAKAYDDSGAVTVSEPIAFTVVPVKGNAAPSVVITSPKAGATYKTLASVQMTATAKDSDGSIKKVEFYNNDSLIKVERYSPYAWSWKRLAAGNYTITARAYDNSGNITISAPVSFKVSATGTVTETGTHVMANPMAERKGTGLSLSAVPNPASSIITITPFGAASGKVGTITIYTLSGVAVKALTANSSNQANVVDISALNPGVYYIHYSTAEGNCSVPFIKL